MPRRFSRISSSSARVLLVWPGAMFEPEGNFGVPQMLNLAQYIRKHASARVDVIDLDMERHLGGFDLARCADYDVVGLSCYSSFDYLKVCEIARLIKELCPSVCLVTGGYHPSARPTDFTRDGTPFDYVAVGDGELPFARLLTDLCAGRTPVGRVLNPAALASPHEVMPYDWSLLDRYRPFARRVASQAEIYLSRGCPYDCSFCMERAKRETAWRSIGPEEAVEELHRLDSWIDLSTWTLRVVDPLFGMKRAWRREFLELLAKRPVRARKTWLLIRVDLVEREDFELMARCNVAPGFGLETGDPAQLRRIRKTGMLSGYLDKMLEVADWAREFHVPFGANIIVGHPGETEQSMRTTAEYVRRLFLDPRGTMGFLSVDPFRLYPGSPIDEQLAQWQADTGFRPHRYPWWEDGDQDFLAEWVDPSGSLTYLRREQLTQELFAPIVASVRDNFTYQGPAADYFRRALDSQLKQFQSESHGRRLQLAALWSELVRLDADSGNHAAAPTALQDSVSSTSAALPASAASTPTAALLDDASLADDAAPSNSTRRRELPLVSVAERPSIRLEDASDWCRLVFHVLAHVNVPELPSTAFHAGYVARAEHFLGAPAERALGRDIATLRELANEHASYSRLQLLAWLFDSIEAAARCSGRALAELGPEDVSRFALLPSLQGIGPAAELLFCAALLEVASLQSLPALGYSRDELVAALEGELIHAPHLARYTLVRCDSLTVFGRIAGQRIWIGTPNAQLGVSARQVARQAAHEATVGELLRRHPEVPEREIEKRALQAFQSRDYSSLTR